MSFNYVDAEIWLSDLLTLPAIGAEYAMCEPHANRMTPPLGWVLTDRRSADRPLFLSLEVA